MYLIINLCHLGAVLSNLSVWGWEPDFQISQYGCGNQIFKSLSVGLGTGFSNLSVWGWEQDFQISQYGAGNGIFKSLSMGVGTGFY